MEGAAFTETEKGSLFEEVTPQPSLTVTSSSYCLAAETPALRSLTETSTDLVKDNGKTVFTFPTATCPFFSYMTAFSSHNGLEVQLSVTSKAILPAARH